MTLSFEKPSGAACEARGCNPLPATHIYGPECEAETGNLMYLCAAHAYQIERWIAQHPFEPVECPTHGRIGMVKGYLILKAL